MAGSDFILEGGLVRVRTAAPKLTGALRRVADYVVANPEAVIGSSVTEVAEASGVSEATVVRLAQELGYRGFQDLKISLARDLVLPVKFIHEDVELGEDVSVVIEKVFRSNMRAVLDTLKVLDPVAMKQAVDLIINAEHVELYGIGAAGLVATDLYYRLMRIGIPCRVNTDSHMQAVSATLTGPGTVVIAISHSGSSKETVDAVRLAKEAGAKAICITNFGKSPIVTLSDVVLFTAAEETRFRPEATASRIAQLSIVDALYVCVAIKRFDASLHNIEISARALSAKRY